MFTGIRARPGKPAQNEVHALIPLSRQATWTTNWELQDYDDLILLCAFPLAFFPASKPQLCLMFLSAKREPWTGPPASTVLLGTDHSLPITRVGWAETYEHSLVLSAAS